MIPRVSRHTGITAGAYQTGQQFADTAANAQVNGRCMSCFGHHKGAGTAYVQLHGIPVGGAASTSTIIATIAVAAGSNFSFPIAPTGLPFSGTLWALLSTTAATYTASANADLLSFATLCEP